jgi:putative resolvase
MQEHFTPAQAAKLLGVTTHTLRVWDKEGKIATIRTPGNQRRIPVSEIARLYTNDALCAEPEVQYANAKKIASDDGSVITDINGLVIDKEMSAGGSGGNLPKWLLTDADGIRFYAKGRSKKDALEPEAEVCACRLAKLFSISAIEYELADLPFLSDDVVCICRDYSDGKKVMSLYRYVQAVTGVNPANIRDGREKLKLVTGVLPEKDNTLHTSILHLDYIVGNRDRHLRNFDVWVNPDGSIIGMIPVFDTGDSLFASESEKEILRACKSGNNFVHSKPYINPHSAQLQLLQDTGLSHALNTVSKTDIDNVINSCFSGKRAEYLTLYVIANTERLGLIR